MTKKNKHPEQDAFDLKYKLVEGVEIESCDGCCFFESDLRCTIPPIIHAKCFVDNSIYKLRC